MLNQKNFPGLDGFVWWTGIVEDRVDPKKIGRLRIRQYGWHTDNKSLIPPEHLFWAQPIFPTNVSNDTYTCKEGDTVLGFFMDGDSCQFPFFFGRFPDIPTKLYPKTEGFSDPGTNMGERPVEVANRTMIDGEGVVVSNAGPKRYPSPLNEPTTSRYARNQNIEKTPLPFIKKNIMTVQSVFNEIWKERNPDYDAKYPYNDSRQSESGHYFDVDDTKGKERICLTHRSGTMMEMKADGTIHHKDMRDHYRLVHGKTYVNYRGEVKKTAERRSKLRGKGKTIIEINNDCEIHVAGNLLVHGGTSLTLASDGVLTLYGDGGIVMNSGSGSTAVASGASSMQQQSASESIPGITINSGSTFTINANYTFNNAYLYTAPIYETLSPNPKATNNPFIKVPYIQEPELIPEEEKTFEERMAEALAAITAPAGSCNNQYKWKYIDENGVEQTLYTHGARPDSEVYEYLFCTGASRVIQYTNDNEIADVGVPSDFVCTI
jgi:hypothetical protein